MSEITDWAWFGIWLRIGLQSFGGGVSTLALIRQELAVKRALITDEEFSQVFALSQLSPGINLVGMAILFGRRHSGTRGAVLATSGMLLPSALITAALTAVYTSVQGLKPVVSAIHFVIPAVGGLGIATVAQTAWPNFKSEAANGASGLCVAATLFVGAGVAVGVFNLPTISVVITAAILGAGFALVRALMRGRGERKGRV